MNEAVGQPAEESQHAFFDGGDMTQGRTDADLEFAALHDERRRAELAFAADDIAFLVLPANHCPLIPLQERPRNAGEQRQLGQFIGFDDPPTGRLALVDLDNGSIRQRSRRARDHALAAGHARRVAHRVVEIEGDAGRVALAHAADDVVFANFVASPHAAIAKDAGVVIHGDHERRIVLTAVGHRLGKPR